SVSLLFCYVLHVLFFLLFFFHAPLATVMYTLSLHDALPIWLYKERCRRSFRLYFLPKYGTVAFPLHITCQLPYSGELPRYLLPGDRKSTRLNSSHVSISYAVFCLKKKKQK